MYTTSFAFFEAISEAGVRYCFVNLGSDHPSIMEAIVRGQKEKPDEFPKIITCPNEMVAMSMADGFARVTNQPQCVIIHVDVGTSRLGAAMHNASTGKAPVLVFAGLSPYTLEGEYSGTRTEYIHWLQDVPDQKSIVSNYCRYIGEIKRGRNVKQMVNRALSFATSSPQGPVYPMGSREAMEEEIEPYSLNQSVWTSNTLGILDTDQLSFVAKGLVAAKSPLIITGYIGREHVGVSALVELASTVRGLRVLDNAGAEMCFPADHAACLGLRYGEDESIRRSDFIIVLECDVPWITYRCHPRADAFIVHIDSDPLKRTMPMFYINAIARFQVDAVKSVQHLCNYLKTHFDQELASETYSNRWHTLVRERQARLSELEIQAQPAEDGSISPSYLMSQLRSACPKDTVWAVMAVTNAVVASNQLQPVLPGSWINCGGGGLGWSGGGSLGVKLAVDSSNTGLEQSGFVCQIVGDGAFLFSVPSTVYWIAQHYKLPVLTVVLNNKGWNAPRKSLLLVHPDGEGSKVNNSELNIAFDPPPHYAGIAKAAACGNAWAGQAYTIEELRGLLPSAVEAVKDGRSAIMDVRVTSSSKL